MRTAFAGPNAVTVSWNTFAQLSNPTVQYGTDPRKLDMVASSNVSITYPSSRTFNNHVKLTGLESFTKYYYKVQYLNCLNCAYRQLGEFTTARAAGDTSSFKVAIVADMGTMGPSGLSEFAPQLPLGANETNAIQSMLQNIDSYEFIAHWGDFAYADCEFGRRYNEAVPVTCSVQIISKNWPAARSEQQLQVLLLMLCNLAMVTRASSRNSMMTYYH